jgi:hypothetical protein
MLLSVGDPDRSSESPAILDTADSSAVRFGFKFLCNMKLEVEYFSFSSASFSAACWMQRVIAHSANGVSRRYRRLGAQS